MTKSRFVGDEKDFSIPRKPRKPRRRVSAGSPGGSEDQSSDARKEIVPTADRDPSDQP